MKIHKLMSKQNLLISLEKAWSFLTYPKNLKTKTIK